MTKTEKKLKQLNTLIEMTALINSTFDIAEIKKRTVDAATTLLGAEAGSLLLRSPEGGLTFDIALGKKGEKLRSLRLQRGVGIAGWVLEHERAQIVNDVGKDPRFFKEADEISGYKTKNLICVPVKSKDSTIGIIEVVNKKTGLFDKDDLEMLEALSNQVALAIENARLYEEAVTDSLTGLYHHRYFELRLSEEIERAKRYAHPLSLIMIDIDHFKSINDRYGHQRGDVVLSSIANILRICTRKGDTVARYGGEEFAIIMPHISGKRAIAAAERLRKTIENIDFGGIKLTISIGVSFFEHEAMTKEQIIKLADNALYKAKKNGRNRVEVLIRN